MSARAKVWLVGSGPGDPGLLTLRGREVIENADVIVYDRLIGCGAAEFFPPSAKLIYVGKRSGSHTATQDEINAILLREAESEQGLGKRRKRIVRLKGGDPFLFGRGGEEALVLREAGVDVEVVPGVTSAISVPAYAGIPVTHRGVSGGLYVVTAHRADDEESLDYAFLAELTDTLVILMGAGRIAEIATRLVSAGKPASTPACVIQNGTTAAQRSVSGTLSDIAERTRENKIEAPAIIIVGPAAELATQLEWRSGLPLSGLRIWLTETKKNRVEGTDADKPLDFLLREEGAEVVRVPCIATEPLDTELPSLEIFREADWLVFSSQVGVASFFRALAGEGRDIRSIGNAKIAAVGPSTARALASRGLCVDFVPEIHDGENMANGLMRLSVGKGSKILIFRCVGEPPAWAEILRSAGANVEEIGLYRTIKTPSPALQNIAPGDAVVFKSASAVEVCADAITCEPATIRAYCIGKPSAEAARKRGFDVVAAARATDEALRDVILKSVAHGLDRRR